MVFVPGKIWTFLLETAYRMRMDEDFHGEGTGRKVECSECGRELAVGSLAGYMAKQHDIYQSFAMVEGDGTPPPLLSGRWNARYYPAENCYRCPVPGCLQGHDGSCMRDFWNVHWLFSFRHRGHKIVMAGECYRK